MATSRPSFGVEQLLPHDYPGLAADRLRHGHPLGGDQVGARGHHRSRPHRWCHRIPSLHEGGCPFNFVEHRCGRHDGDHLQALLAESVDKALLNGSGDMISFTSRFFTGISSRLSSLDGSVNSLMKKSLTFLVSRKAKKIAKLKGEK